MNRYSDMTIWQLREELAAIKGELTTRDVTPREPNAAAQAGQGFSSAPSHEGHAAGPAPAAPVAEMVRRLREVANARDQHGENATSVLLREAATLLARLGQGWAPEQDRFKRRPSAGQCKCEQHEIPIGVDGINWYWQRHSREACTLELPNRKCWCGLLRSEHIKGHAEGVEPPVYGASDE